jgi:YidC/Oxa1 family membrane protein insertase
MKTQGKWYQRITMDKNNIIGLILIFGILMGYSYFTAPTPQQLAEQERITDSIRIAEERIAAMRMAN